MICSLGLSNIGLPKYFLVLTEEKNSAPNVALPTSRSGKVVFTVE